jgi:division protein CdvB (Snf7/Vps24/ESCRT-III family)
MIGFFTNWTKNKKNRADDTNKKLIEDLIPNSHVKPRIESVMNDTQLQISKLDVKISKIKEREETIFNKVVDAMKSHDIAHTKIWSVQLARLRKNQLTLNQARIALEQVSMRISTIHVLSEIMETLEPAMSPVKGLKSDFEISVPSTDTDTELNYMQMLTNSILSDSNQYNEIDIIGMNIGELSEKDDIGHIINEASEVAEELNNSYNNNRFSSFSI